MVGNIELDWTGRSPFIVHQQQQRTLAEQKREQTEPQAHSICI